MLAAALQTDSEAHARPRRRDTFWTLSDTVVEDYVFLVSTDDYKEFGTNCESMAAEIEDHILSFNSSVTVIAALISGSFGDFSNPDLPQ